MSAVRASASTSREIVAEKSIVTLVGEGAEDAAHVGCEAHVEHPVGLVEHEDLELRIIDVPALHVIEQPAGRRDHDVHAARERPGLRLHPHAAVDRRGAQVEVPPVRASALQHLLGELTRRDENQRPQGVTLAGRQALENRQHERGRLARPRLGGPDEIPAAEGERNGFLLNRGWLGITFVGHGPHELGG